MPLMGGILTISISEFGSGMHALIIIQDSPICNDLRRYRIGWTTRAL